MALKPVLIVNVHFNPPTFTIIGPIKETTLQHLQDVLPTSTTTMRGQKKTPPAFAHVAQPAHWSLRLDGQFCDQLGMSQLFLRMLECLEEEGGWVLKDTTGNTLDDDSEAYKFFFLKKST
eukprot:PhM_4_TR14009/c0_g1_i1/m.61703